MMTKQQIDENIKIFNKSKPDMFSEYETNIYNQAKEIINKKTKVPCILCRYCFPCPEEIYIPRIFEVYNFAHTTSMKEARAYFQKQYAESVQKCTQCGGCADRCPQNIKIPQLLKIIATELGTV